MKQKAINLLASCTGMSPEALSNLSRELSAEARQVQSVSNLVVVSKANPERVLGQYLLTHKLINAKVYTTYLGIVYGEA